MSGLTIFIIGLLVGWVLEWFIDRVFWQVTEEEIQAAEEAQVEKEQVQSELDAAQAEIAALQGQVETFTAQGEDADAKIDELELALEEVSTKLAVHDAEYEAENAEDAGQVDEAASDVEPDDLTAIEGVGPKIDGILKAAGYQTYNQLAQADVEHIRGVLAEAGSRYKLAVPDTWPEQAVLAAKGEWETLEALHDSLAGGRRADDEGES